VTLEALDGNTCATSGIDVWIEDLKKEDEYKDCDKDFIVKTLVGGKSRFEELRQIFSVVSNTVKFPMVVTNNICRDLIADIVKTIEGNADSKYEVHSMRLLRIRKCTFLNKWKITNNISSKILFFDDNVTNFVHCGDDVIKVAVTATATPDPRLELQAQEINNIFTEEGDECYKNLAIKTRGEKRLTTFDSKSGMRMRMRSQTRIKDSSQEWIDYINEVESER
jgi:hypothetical protein